MNLFEYVENLTSGDRRKDYDHPLPNHLRISIIWSVMKGVRFNPVEVAFMMGSGLKAAREVKTPKFDNVVDTTGYMNCINEMINLLIEMGYSEYDNSTLTFEQNRTNAMEYLSGLSIGEQWMLIEECNGHQKRGSISKHVDVYDLMKMEAKDRSVFIDKSFELAKDEKFEEFD